MNEAEWLACTDPVEMLESLAGEVSDRTVIDRLSSLAEALKDAGCDDKDILSHCHSKRPHARGCWVVDLLLAES